MIVMACAISSCVPSTSAAQPALCLEAERFVRDVMGMTALAEPDTIDDWRTQSRTAGCRVTAAGATTASSTEVARGFFEVIPEHGWERTPDPRDAPNEASIRYRKGGADCLFSFYDSNSALNTDAELYVSEAVFLRLGERLYHFLVMCTPAAPAAPRGSG